MSTGATIVDRTSNMKCVAERTPGHFEQASSARKGVCCQRKGDGELVERGFTCMVSLNDHVAYVLFDLGAMHSFIIEEFVKLG